MLGTTVLVEGAGVAVGEVICDEPHGTWSAEEPICTFALVLLRRGSFDRQVDGAEHLADAITAYVQRPGSVQRISHRTAGDVSTVMAPEPAMLGELAEQALDLDAIPIPPAADLDHRMLLARARAGAEPFELTERSVILAGSLIRDTIANGAGLRAKGVSRRASALADDIRDAISEDFNLRLDGLADLVGLPAYELSRAFRRATGETVSRYRLRLRLHRALERMADGDRDLAGVAVESGFADQAHFTRAMREETGWTPGAFRSELATPDLWPAPTAAG